MMPAMYSAISGLEAHQTMLERDRQQPGERRHDRLQGAARRRSIRALAADHRRLRPDRVQRRHQPRAGRPRRAGRLDRQHHVRRLAGSRPATRSTSRSRATASSWSATAPARRALRRGFANARGVGERGVPIAPTADGRRHNAALPTANQYTRAGNLTTDSQGYLTTASGQYVMGYDRAPRHDHDQPNTYIHIPPGSTNVSIGQTARSPTPTTTQRRHVRQTSPPAISRSPLSRTRPA